MAPAGKAATPTKKPAEAAAGGGAGSTRPVSYVIALVIGLAAILFGASRIDMEALKHTVGKILQLAQGGASKTLESHTQHQPDAATQAAAPKRTCAADDAECIKARALENAHLPKGANPEGKPLDVSLQNCKDRHAQCAGFQKNNECVKNPGWMIVNCPDSCKACHLLDPKVRCNRSNLNISTDPIYKPGDMKDMFDSILPSFGDRYGVTVVSTDPYVVTFDNFMTDEEVDALISTVEGGWERSTDTGSSNEFGETGRVLSQGRTSSNAWCRAPCENNNHVKNVLKKITEVTRVPRENFESFQILRYEVGQAYNPHHDASQNQVRLACGPRILTFFLYLSDVEEGGETGFPLLKGPDGEPIAIKPKKGSALLWPSTKNENPEEIDSRTLHQAKAVIKGRKFAANTWIHLHNFEKSNLWGCTGELCIPFSRATLHPTSFLNHLFLILHLPLLHYQEHLMSCNKR